MENDALRRIADAEYEKEVARARLPKKNKRYLPYSEALKLAMQAWDKVIKHGRITD